MRSGGSLDDVAILVRAQFQTREFEERFIAIGLPYQIIGGFRFYERAEIRDAIAYLRLIQSPADDLAFERIVNTPKRGLGDKAVATIHQRGRDAQEPLLIAAARLLDSDELTPQARRSLGNFVADLGRWREMATSLPHPELARIVLEECGYTAMLQADRSAKAPGASRTSPSSRARWKNMKRSAPFSSTSAWSWTMTRRAQGEKVTIMTIHAAKGLEFDTVFLAGWEEGVFPSQRSLDEGGLASLEEERRLAYVAITRARRRCTILHAANRRIYGQWTSSIPSRFVAELPKAHIEEETTMTGGESLWRAQWSERADPFAHLGPAQSMRASTRGPGWQRASRGNFDPEPQRVIEARASAVVARQPGPRPTSRSASASSTASSATAPSKPSKATSSRSSSRRQAERRCSTASSARSEDWIQFDFTNPRTQGMIEVQLNSSNSSIPASLPRFQISSPAGMLSPSTKAETNAPVAGSSAPSICSPRAEILRSVATKNWPPHFRCTGHRSSSRGMVRRSRAWLTSLRLRSAITSMLSSNRTPSWLRLVQATFPAARWPVASSTAAFSPRAGAQSLATITPSALILRIEQGLRVPEM